LVFYLCAMNSTILDDKTFTELNYAKTTERNTEFNNCVFKKCDFSDAEFALCKFIDCVFEDCNLSMMKLDRSTLNHVVFKKCKILGVSFSPSEDFLFSVRFESCMLDYSSFMAKKMPKTNFIKSSLKEVTFTEAIDECDLNGAVFNRTDLTSVNFTTASNFIIDPELNTMKRAMFSASGLEGLLLKYGIKVIG
jgi:fluoroquinolone resistance protein